MSDTNVENEYKLFSGSKNLIVCFGGMALVFGKILPFEFLRYLSSIYPDVCDLLFFIDKNQCWYHKGIQGITSDIDETVCYLNDIIKKGNYEKVIFMGTSSGGYAAILFGSLCNVHNVISFIPQTMLTSPINPKYSDLKSIINEKTKYLLYGNSSHQDKTDIHHICQCENISHFPNVTLLMDETCNLKELRDNGFIKKTIDAILF